MLLIPAIDLKNGRCVRLLQGDAASETVYSDDPVAMARSFENAGAKRLHLVDCIKVTRVHSLHLLTYNKCHDYLGLNP